MAANREFLAQKTLNAWEGSEAERFLRQDMDENKHKTIKPKALWKSQKVYCENYPLDVFRRHIDQEERRRKYIFYLQQKDKHIKGFYPLNALQMQYLYTLGSSSKVECLIVDSVCTLRALDACSCHGRPRQSSVVVVGPSSSSGDSHLLVLVT